MQGDAGDAEQVSAIADDQPPLVERGPLDDTLVPARALPQPAAEVRVSSFRSAKTRRKPG